MASPFHSLMGKTESALKTLTTAQVSGGTELLGTDTATAAKPAVVCEADSISEEVELGTGVYTVSASVTVEHQAADTTVATHNSDVAKVFDVVRDDVAAAALGALVTDYHVYEVRQRGEEKDNDERTWRQRILLDIICCAADFT